MTNDIYHNFNHHLHVWSVELIVARGNDKLKRSEACARIDGEMTTNFRSIKVINSYVGNKGDCFRKILDTNINGYRCLRSIFNFCSELNLKSRIRYSRVRDEIRLEFKVDSISETECVSCVYVFGTYLRILKQYINRSRGSELKKCKGSV